MFNAFLQQDDNLWLVNIEMVNKQVSGKTGSQAEARRVATDILIELYCRPTSKISRRAMIS